MAELHVDVLGGLRVRVGDEEVVGFRSEKARALLAYVAVEADQIHYREPLADLLWGDLDRQRALTNLRVVLSDLRHRLGTAVEGDDPTLRISREGLRFLSPPGTVDVIAIRETANHVRSHAHDSLDTCAECHRDLVVAAERCRGAFLDGLSPIGGPFDDWRAIRNQRALQDAQWVRHRLAAQHLSAGDLGGAIACAQRQLADEPWDEEAHRTVMRALWLDGRRAAALAHYDVCEQVLADELGVAPAVETSDLRDQIESDQAVPSLAPMHRHRTLPRDIGRFVGRDDEVGALVALLADDVTPLVTVIGPGGIGKTRTAIAAARQLLARASDQVGEGVVFVDLSPIADALVAGEPAAGDRDSGGGLDHSGAVVAAMGRALGYWFSPGASARDQLLDYLESRRMILLLDNVDGLVGAGVPTLVAEIVSRAPGVKIMATSRSRLDLMAESLVPLEGLALPDVDLDFADSDAVTLFTDRAARGAPGFDLWAEVADVVEICRMVGGSPLAIELAAAQVGIRTCAEVAASMRYDIAALTTTRPDVSVRQRGVMALFESSWALLSSADRQLLAGLSVFRGTFAAYAAQRVAGADSDGLSRLAGASLLARDEDGRYRLHALVRQFALAKAEAEAPALGLDTGALHERHSDVYLRLLATGAGRLGKEGSQDAIAQLAPERADILAGWAHAATTRRWSTMRDALPGLSRYLRLTGAWSEAAIVLSAAADALDAVPDGQLTPDARLLAAEVAVERAGLANAGGDYRAALAHTRGALGSELPDEMGADLARMGAHREEVAALTLLGELDAALAATELGLELAAGPSKEHPEAWAGAEGALHADRGQVLSRYGRFDEAERAFDEALDCYRTIGDLGGEADVLGGLGGIGENLGQWSDARRWWGRRLEIQRLLGDRPGEGTTELSLGVVCYYAGDYLGAREHYEACLVVCADIGDRRHEGMALGNLGCVYRQLGDYDRARDLHERGLALKGAIGYREGEAWGLTCLSLICHLQGEDADARRYRERALELYQDMHNRVGEGYGLIHRGHDLLAGGDVDGAKAAYEAALKCRDGVPHLTAETRAGLTRAHLAAGDVAAASELVELILDHLEEGSLDGTEQPFRVYLTCIQVLKSKADDRAEPLLQRAVEDLLARANALDADERAHYLADVDWRADLLQLAGVSA